MRCPTVIEKVLKIVNAPTNSEMNAKISNAVVMTLRSWSIELVIWLAAWAPVRTCRSAGSACRIWRSSTTLSAPGFARM